MGIVRDINPVGTILRKYHRLQKRKYHCKVKG